jgi:anti-anti-sigma factor
MNAPNDIVEVIARVESAAPVCAIRGEIDASNVDLVMERVLAATPPDGRGIVLDLAETRYLDSAGVRILFELARRLRARRQELRIAVPIEGVVRRVLVLTALADVVPLHDDVDDAAAALRGRS